MRHNRFTCIDPSFPRSSCAFDVSLVPCGSNGTSPIPRPSPKPQASPPNLAGNGGAGQGGMSTATGLVVTCLSAAGVLALIVAVVGAVACIRRQGRRRREREMEEARRSLSERFDNGRGKGWAADGDRGKGSVEPYMVATGGHTGRWWEQELEIDKVLSDRQGVVVAVREDGDGVVPAGGEAGSLSGSFTAVGSTRASTPHATSLAGSVRSMPVATGREGMATEQAEDGV
ncbi:hypothetical protein HK101_002172 [Irineochytrium annulatum]|nr:hypothetical protein HK101_002172 [Irineochytrium annulatum]